MPRQKRMKCQVIYVTGKRKKRSIALSDRARVESIKKCKKSKHVLIVFSYSVVLPDLMCRKGFKA